MITRVKHETQVISQSNQSALTIAPVSPPKVDKVRDLPITGLRLQPELRATLQREANINRVSLNAECERRLLESVRRSRADGEASAAGSEGEQRPSLIALKPPRHQPAGIDGAPLTDAERMLLSLFSSLSPDKQLALLTFLRR